MSIAHLNYDDHEAFREALDTAKCPYCGYVGVEFIGPGKGPHYAAFYCPDCTERLDWMPWPPRSKAEEKRKRSKPLTVLDSDACWYCGLSKVDAAELGMKLERAHTIERAALIEAGLPPDDPLNLPILCSECHAEQHRKREMRARYARALSREKK